MDQARMNAIETLRDLKLLVDGSLEYFEGGLPLIQDGRVKPMAYDILLGGRFGVIDLHRRAREEKEWRL